MGAARRIAVFCVGNKLMLDDGVGPAVYEELLTRYDIPDNVELFDLGCLSLNMIERVREYDVIITVDAVDGTDADPGTVFRFEPDAMAEGLCLGMQVENPSPAVVTVGLTPKVDAALPLLVETVAGELARLGSPLRARA